MCLDYIIPIFNTSTNTSCIQMLTGLDFYSVPCSSGGNGIFYFSLGFRFVIYLLWYLLVEDDSNLGGGNARFGYVN